MTNSFITHVISHYIFDEILSGERPFNYYANSNIKNTSNNTYINKYKTCFIVYINLEKNQYSLF